MLRNFAGKLRWVLVTLVVAVAAVGLVWALMPDSETRPYSISVEAGHDIKLTWAGDFDFADLVPPKQVSDFVTIRNAGDGHGYVTIDNDFTDDGSGLCAVIGLKVYEDACTVPHTGDLRYGGTPGCGLVNLYTMSGSQLSPGATRTWCFEYTIPEGAPVGSSTAGVLTFTLHD